MGEFNNPFTPYPSDLFYGSLGGSPAALPRLNLIMHTKVLAVGGVIPDTVGINDLTQISGTPGWNATGTYKFAASAPLMGTLGHVEGVADVFYSDIGVPLNVTYADILANLTGLKGYANTKGVAVYSVEQTAKDAKIKRILGYPPYDYLLDENGQIILDDTGAGIWAA